MNFQARVLAPIEIDEILAFEMQKLESSEGDEMSRMLASWSAKWRREALESYLPLGWSFALRDEQERLQGYFLAQPLLFFRGQTQSLWVEYMAFNSDAIREQLVGLAIGWGRDKHLQRVLFADSSYHPKGEQIAEQWTEVKTTKA